MKTWLHLSLALLLVGTSCGGDDGSGDGTWLPHVGGTVCKGADALPVSGLHVYISPTGDDTNPGDATDVPFATLARALCSASPGQTIHVGLGTYRESVILSDFGDSSNPITITGEMGSSGELPVVDCESTRSYALAIVGEDDATQSGGFVIQNLELRNCMDAGIAVILAENITLRDIILRGNGFHGTNPDNGGEGFGADLVDVRGLTVDGVEGIDNGPEDAVYQRGILGNDIAIWGSEDVVVRNCYTHDGVGGGLLLEDCVNALAEDNRFSAAELVAPHDEVDGAIWVDGGHDIVVRNNIIDGNHGPGLQISDEGVQAPYGYLFENNVISNNDVGVLIWNFGVCPWPDPSVVEMVGNTFLDNAQGDVQCEAWACGDHQPCD